MLENEKAWLRLSWGNQENEKNIGIIEVFYMPVYPNLGGYRRLFEA